MRRHVWLALIVLVLAAAPALADTPAGTFRVFLASTNPSGDFSGDVEGIPAVVEADSTVGLGLFYEVRLNERFGLDSGIYFVDFDFDLKALGQTVEFGSAPAIPLIFAANFHPRTGEKVDFYVGPLVAYTFWGNLDTPAGTVSLDGDFGFGGVAGLDVKLSEGGLIFNAGLRYLTTAAADPSAEIDVNPFFVEFGLGYRF